MMFFAGLRCRTVLGVATRVGLRLLALAAGIWHNWLLWEQGITDEAGRHFTAYTH